MNKIPRLRMFAGANGSGKTTLKEQLSNSSLNISLGIYINPDELEAKIKASNYLDFTEYAISINQNDLLSFLEQSTLLKQAGLLEDIKQLYFIDDKLSFSKITINSYFASVIADFIRHKLLTSATSFTFETVMSSPDKVDFLKKAQACGFRTYLYYVTTQDPSINISRVKHRIKMGGHAVPENKIIERYYRSLDLLFEAVQYSHRAYIFDNSVGNNRILLAEITNGEELEIKTDLMPSWFKTALWDKFDEP